jgi:hypothetical protein
MVELHQCCATCTTNTYKICKGFLKNINTHKVHKGGLQSYIPFQLGKLFTYDVMIYDVSFFSLQILKLKASRIFFSY